MIKDTETNETSTNLKYSGNLQVEAVSCTNSIVKDNEIITTKPTLTKSATDANENGLYKVTTDNGTTSVFRGIVENNYVLFASKIWRIIRVNEDGTIRMIISSFVDNYSYASSSNASITKMRYNESKIKNKIDSWYNSNLKTKESSIANSTFCDEFKVSWNSNFNYKNIATIYSSYTSTMNCKNPFTEKIGLITYDEANFAGLHYSSACSNCYLKYGTSTMSISGYNGWHGKIWFISDTVKLETENPGNGTAKYPVISLNANVEVTGNGTSSNPYKIN